MKKNIGVVGVNLCRKDDNIEMKAMSLSLNAQLLLIVSDFCTKWESGIGMCDLIGLIETKVIILENWSLR
jgi:hypothetical protein